MKLENKVAIITGGTKGIGYGIAEEYLKEGAKITICSRNAQEGVKAAKELGKLGEVLYLQADVSSIEDNQMLVDETVKKYGRLDIFVANAGINDPDKTHYLHITEEQYDRILGVNLKGLFFGGHYGDELAVFYIYTNAVEGDCFHFFRAEDLMQFVLDGTIRKR